MKQAFYVAVIVSELRSSAPDYEPLYEESFVLIVADSFEEAVAKAKARAQEEHRTYENQYGDTISWSPRLKAVGQALVDKFEDGAEFFVRFSRNRAAYDQLEFESFDKDGTLVCARPFLTLDGCPWQAKGAARWAGA